MRRWGYWHSRRPQTARTQRLRGKWWNLHLEAQRVLHRTAVALEKSQPTDARSKAIAWAHSKVGIHEEPPSSNRGPWIDVWQRVFGFLAAPWCGLFVGNALRAAGVKGVTSRIASVGAIQTDAEAHRGCFYGYTPGSARGALHGDLVILFGFGVHVELIRSVNADGSVNTIGGNTSANPNSGNQSDGGCVAEHTRSAAEIHGVAHVRYG